MADSTENPYGDPFEDDRWGDDGDDDAVASAADALTSISGGARVLTIAAMVAAGLWLLAIISSMWSWYDLARQSGVGITFSGGTNSSFLFALGQTLGTTWGYLLVSVIAYLGSMLLQGQRLRLLVDAAADDD